MKFISVELIENEGIILINTNQIQHIESVYIDRQSKIMKSKNEYHTEGFHISKIFFINGVIIEVCEDIDELNELLNNQ